MISRKRVIYKCVALLGAACLILFVIKSNRATSSDDDVPRLMGREHINDQESMDLQALHIALRSRGKVDGQYTTRTLSAKDGPKELSGVEDIVHEEQNEWINSAQLNAKFQLSNDLHQGDSKEPHPPVQENVETLDEPRSQDEWKRHLPVIIDGEHLQDDFDHDPRQDGEQNDEGLLKDAKGKLKAFVKPDGVADVARAAAFVDKTPPIVKNKTAPAKPARKRVRVIRRTVRNGKVIHEEVVGIKTVITNPDTNATKIVVKGDVHIRSYDEVWYSDILNGNFKANQVQLRNKTRDTPYLTEKLWRFQDTNSERLFLYERMIQHGWRKNLTNLMHLRQELSESGVDAANDLVVTQENAQLGSSLPFYISTKVPVGDKTERVYSYNVSAEFRKNIPEVSPFRGKTHKRCAVVGNSGSILNSGCGAEIDDFDMIFRCNAAPIDKYAHDAGWKSNITTFNPSIFYRRFNALQTRDDYLHFMQNITQYNGYIWLACFGSAALHNVCLTPVLAQGSRKPNEPHLVVSNPNQFANFWQFWKTRNVSKTPSTGFFMTHAALELCEETHLYGFWPFPLRLDSGFERVPYHYFDDLVVSKRHGMSDEFSVFLQYHELGILRIHTGKCQSEKT
eukprot:XP_003726357.1 PREDICTED: uncharacterized protein LOC100889741 [Strongylocentrotus purpuratus]